jgi:hypothetical protein
MSQERFADMSEAEIDALTEGHIERTASGSGEMPPDVFVDLRLDRITAKTETTLTLAIEVQGDQVVITPDRDSADVVMQGNEVLINGHRLILQLAHRSK